MRDSVLDDSLANLTGSVVPRSETVSVLARQHQRRIEREELDMVSASCSFEEKR